MTWSLSSSQADKQFEGSAYLLGPKTGRVMESAGKLNIYADSWRAWMTGDGASRQAHLGTTELSHFTYLPTSTWHDTQTILEAAAC